MTQLRTLREGTLLYHGTSMPVDVEELGRFYGGTMKPVGYLGQPPVREQMPPDSPPSVYAIAAVLDGESGAAWRVTKLTAQRVLFIAPGLYAFGLRGKELLSASALTSVSITGTLMLYYWLKNKKGLDLPEIE